MEAFKREVMLSWGLLEGLSFCAIYLILAF